MKTYLVLRCTSARTGLCILAKFEILPNINFRPLSQVFVDSTCGKLSKFTSFFFKIVHVRAGIFVVENFQMYEELY